MIEWDADFVIVGWNAAAATLFSFFEEEALGQRIDELLRQRQIADLEIEDWMDCSRSGVLREHVGIGGKKRCRWYNTPFMHKGQRVSTLSTIIDITCQTTLSNEELRAQLQSRTQMLKHTTSRLQLAMSDRAQTHEALHKSEIRFKSIAANVPAVLYQFCLHADGHYSVPYISAACEEVYELSAETIQQDPQQLFSLINADDRLSLELGMRQSADSLVSWNSEHRFVTPSGRSKWVQMASRPQPMAEGNTLWSGMIIDITARKQAEANLQKSEHRLRSQTKQLKATLKKLKHAQVKLVQSEKMSSLGQLVAGIAHEINNPANFIYGNLEHIGGYTQDMLKLIRLYQAHYPTPNSTIQTLTDELELDYVASDLPKLLDSLNSGVERIRTIVLSLRNFSRLDETGLKPTDIHEGLENTLMLLASRLNATISRPAIKIVKAYEKIPSVDCYASQLNQVFMNILLNAIDCIDEADAPSDASTQHDEQRGEFQDEPQTKPQIEYIQRPHQIVLQTFKKDERAVIQITNSGPPIPEDIAQRMFDPFFTTKSVGKGTGMGLAISYQTIVDLHKGALEYTQTAEGKTTFIIEIPISQVPPS